MPKYVDQRHLPPGIKPHVVVIPGFQYIVWYHEAGENADDHWWTLQARNLDDVEAKKDMIIKAYRGGSSGD